ncbi:MAG TPA: membrane dipeptidase [Gemmatimonadota bacterium]|jgi:membrane dipeptidase
MYGGSIVFDGHMDTPLRMVDDGVDLGVRRDAGHADLPRLAEGGVDAVFLAAWVDPALADGRARARAETLIGAVREAARAHPERCALATTAADVRAAAAGGRVALLVGIENGQAIEGDPGAVARFAALGVRYLTLTWMNSNELGDAAGGEPRAGGLTALGHEVVAEMEREGVLVDLAHAAPATFWETLSVARRPVIVSHAATEARGAHPRNLTDDQIRAVAETGGIVGVAFYPAYLDPSGGRCDREAIALHLLRILEVAGADHAALGSDLDGIPRLPDGFRGAQDFGLVAGDLERRGVTGDDLAKVLGGNWLRMLEAAATPLRT